MTVRGTNQAGTLAIADVLRISPLVDTNAPLRACSSNIVVPCSSNGAVVSFAVNAAFYRISLP